MKKLLLVAVYMLSFTCLNAQTWDWAAGSSTTPSGTYIESWVIGVDTMGNAYTAGVLTGLTSALPTAVFGSFVVPSASDEQTVIVSTDPDGNYRWALCAGGSTSGAVSNPNSMAVSPGGNVYLIGTLWGTMTLGTLSTSTSSESTYITKINSSGTPIWLTNINVGLGGSTAIAIDAVGNSYITGYFFDSAITIGSATLHNHDPSGNTSDMFLVKLDTSGNPVWAEGFGGDSTDIPTALAVSAYGQIYIAGTFRSDTVVIGNTLTNNNIDKDPYIFTAKCDASGHALWANKGIAVTSGSTASANGIAVDQWDNVYIVGGAFDTVIFGGDTLFNAAAEFQDFLVKYNASGNQRFAQLIGSGTVDTTYAQVWSVAVDNCGHLWASGGVDYPSDKMFVSEYDSTGNQISTVFVPAGGDDQSNVAVDNKGHLYVGGDYAVSFRLGADTLTKDTATGEALFVLRLSYPYNFCPACIVPMVSFTDTGTNTLGFTYTGTTTGVDSLVWNYGDGNIDTGITAAHTYSTSGTYTVCVTAYTTCGGDSYCHTVSVIATSIPFLSLFRINVYPNPATTQLTIFAPQNITAISITNLLGQTVYSSQDSGGVQAGIDITDLPSGVYLVRVNGSVVRKFVKE